MVKEKIIDLVNQAIQLKRSEDETKKALTAIKRKLRSVADRKRKDGETMIRMDGDGGVVKVIYGEALKLDASFDDVLKTLGSKTDDVFIVDRTPKIKVPEDFEERLEQLSVEEADQARTLTVLNPTTPKVQIEAVAS